MKTFYKVNYCAWHPYVSANQLAEIDKAIEKMENIEP